MLSRFMGRTRQNSPSVVINVEYVFIVGAKPHHDNAYRKSIRASPVKPGGF